MKGGKSKIVPYVFERGKRKAWEKERKKSKERECAEQMRVYIFWIDNIFFDSKMLKNLISERKELCVELSHSGKEAALEKHPDIYLLCCPISLCKGVKRKLVVQRFLTSFIGE